MGILSNPRHERFAQELAQGKSATEAYINAGYDVGSDKSAGEAGSRLSKNVKVQERLRELQGRAAIRAEISVARFTEDLLRIAEKAEAVDSPPGFAVAKGAIMDAAKLNGLVIERKELGQPGEFDGLTTNELRDRLRREAEELGEGAIAASLSGGERETRGKPH
jgi:Terminase small subunit